MRRPFLKAVLTAIAAATLTVLFAPMGDWMAHDPLPIQAWVRDHLGLSAALPRVSLTALALLQFRGDGGSAGPVPDNGKSPRDRWLDDLRVTIRKEWIDKVLARSLAHVVQTELNFAERTDLLMSPIEVQAAAEPRYYWPGTSLAEIFSDKTPSSGYSSSAIRDRARRRSCFKSLKSF